MAQLPNGRAGTTVRLVLGAEFLAGLRKHPALVPTAERLAAAQRTLSEVHDRRRALELALVEARADVTIEELELRQVVQGLGHRAAMVDHAPRGPLAVALLPAPVDALLRVGRAEQASVCRALLGRFQTVQLPGIEALRREEEPRLRERLAIFEASLARFLAAEEAVAEARRHEVALRDVHVRELDRARAETVAAFPRDRARQRAILPAGPRRAASASPVLDVEHPAA